MNRATRIIVSTIGVFLGLSGIDHGFFEILQGNTPTSSLIINAIGPEHIMWEYGGEAAFTLIPNFLLTGILANLVGILIIIWSVGFIHRKHGATIFGLLLILLFLVGGGIAAPILFGLPTWAAATRINKPLIWWQKVFPPVMRGVLAKVWPITLTIGMISVLIGLYIAITGIVPGVDPSEVERILSVDWFFVFGGGLGMFLISIVCGFAADIEQQDS
jgi:hypothetical protein